jgi:hypothetical protein
MYVPKKSLAETLAIQCLEKSDKNLARSLCVSLLGTVAQPVIPSVREVKVGRLKYKISLGKKLARSCLS